MKDPCNLPPSPLLSVEEALSKIASAVSAIATTERVALKEAVGRVLAESIHSPINLPYDRNSAMDGYAISSRDIDANQTFSLELAGTSWAGKPYLKPLKPGQCIRIFTGAVIPEGADSVVIQEKVQADGQRITFPANAVPFENIREAGEDLKPGDQLCPAGKKLMPAELGLLAAAGIEHVPVFRKLNIAYFSTGDELVSLDQSLNPGKIYDSNRYALHGLLAEPRFNATDLGAIADNKNILETTLQQAAATYDVIITTGGASVGDADYVHEILGNLGQVNFWKIAIKPGKPLVFGKIGNCYFFGLPGNPVSVMVTFDQVVKPALSLFSGALPGKPLRFQATCTSVLKKAPGRQEFQRGILSQDASGTFSVAVTGKQGSNIISSQSRANCYIVLPTESVGAKVGDSVWVEPFSHLI